MPGVRIPDRWFSAHSHVVMAALIDQGYMTPWPHQGRMTGALIVARAQQLYRELRTEPPASHVIVVGPQLALPKDPEP